MKAKRTRRIAGIIALWGALVCTMGIDCCEEPIVFPVPEQQSIAVDDTAELLMEWSFENCDGGWTGDGDPIWECAKPSTGPRAGVEGEGNVLATIADGTIPTRFDGSIASPVVDLVSGQGEPVFLSIWHWYNFAGVDDGWSKGGGRVEVFHEGVWKPVVPAGGYDGAISATGTSLHGEDGFNNSGIPRTWRRSFFDITNFVSPDLRVRFHAVNNSGQEREGWYVDDVQIWRGTFSVHMPETSMGSCEPGAAVSFALGACDEGWGVLGDGAWRCGVPTRNADVEGEDGPAGDSPAFDRDGSRQLWGTALSGDLPRGTESSLVSPAIDAGRCAGGSLKLGFWHWYHFGPGGGGFVQVFDGETWVDVAPTSGYPGEIGGGAFWRESYGHEAFVSETDAPSGWRYEVIDISEYAREDLRVRFVVSSDNGEARPGWYVDTIELVQDGLDSVVPMVGSPNEPMCGLAPKTLTAEQVKPGVARDACAEGETVLDWRFLLHDPEQPGQPTTQTFRVNHERPGTLCAVLVNGENGVDSATVTSAGVEVIGRSRFGGATDVAMRAIETEGTEASFTVETRGEPGSAARFQVRYQPAGGYVSAQQEEGALPRYSDFTVGYHDELRPGRDGNSTPTTTRLYDLSFDVELPQTRYDVVGLDGAVAYVVQIMDTTTCGQVREIRGWQGFAGDETQGLSRGPIRVRTRWDGTDDAGNLVAPSGEYIFRVYAYPALAKNLAGRSDEVIVPQRADVDLPNSVTNIDPADFWVDFDDVTAYQNAGIARVNNRHGLSLDSLAGGERLTLWTYFAGVVFVSDAPDGFLEDLGATSLTYDPWPTGWIGSGPFPYLTEPADILRLLDLTARNGSLTWSWPVEWTSPQLLGGSWAWVAGSNCGEDSNGVSVCGETFLWTTLPQDEALYLRGEEMPVKHQGLWFSFEEKPEIETDLDTGIAQTNNMRIYEPLLGNLKNYTTWSLGQEVRWNERVGIDGLHLWTYQQAGTPDYYRVRLCAADQEDEWAAIAGLQPINLGPGLADHSRHVFPIGEWPFAVSGGAAADTDIRVKGVFDAECDDPAAQQVIGSGMDIALVPPNISGAGTETADDVVEVTVMQSSSIQRVDLLGAHLGHYQIEGYMSGSLDGLPEGNIVVWSPSPSGTAISIPANAAIGHYHLSRSLNATGFASGVAGPEIYVRIEQPPPTITGIEPDDVQWRDDAGDEYFVEVEGSGFDAVDEDNIVVALNGNTAYGQVVPGSKTSSSFEIFFPYSSGVAPGLYDLWIGSTGGDPPFVGTTSIDDFRVKGFADGDFASRHTWTRDLSTCSSSASKTVDLVETSLGEYSINFIYDSNQSGAENVSWHPLDANQYCSGFIVSEDCNTILMCNIINDSTLATSLFMLHYYEETGEWVSELLDSSVADGLYHNELYFMAVGPDGKTAVISQPLGGSNYDVAVNAYRFGDSEDEYDNVSNWGSPVVDCHNGSACYDLLSVHQQSDRIDEVMVGTAYDFLYSGPIDLWFPL